MSNPVLLLTHPAPGIVQLTLNRPAQSNAVSIELANLLEETLDGLRSPSAARVILITGAGEAFSGGYDIQEMRTLDAQGMLAAHARRDPILWKLATHPTPVIAAVNGPAYGAGALIASCCDLRVGGPTSRFRVTATGYGYANATWTLPQIVGGPKAREILLTGRTVEPDEGFAIGLYNHMAGEGAGVVARAMAIAAQIAAHPPAGPREVKRLITESVGRRLEDQFQAEHMATSTRPFTSGAENFAGSKIKARPDDGAAHAKR